MRTAAEGKHNAFEKEAGRNPGSLNIQSVTGGSRQQQGEQEEESIL